MGLGEAVGVGVGEVVYVGVRVFVGRGVSVRVGVVLMVEVGVEVEVKTTILTALVASRLIELQEPTSPIMRKENDMIIPIRIPLLIVFSNKSID